jgi:RNA polymerase sigma factor (sigma-70 family)
MGEWDQLRSCDATVQTALAAKDFQRALELLVHGYQDIVIGFCCNMLGNRELGEEVAQKAFLAVYEAMPGYRQEASIRTWLFAIVRRLCLKERQHTQRRRWILRHHIQAIRGTLHSPRLWCTNRGIRLRRDSWDMTAAALNARKFLSLRADGSIA